MPVPHFPKRYADWVARLRVPSGFLLVATFAWLAAPSPQSLAIGLPVSILGLLLRGWAAGHLAKNRNLATSGPYGHLRNPLYVGTLTVAAGLVVAAQRWLLAAIFGAVFLFVYLPVIELEEQHLRRLFPEYGGYAERVPALLPRLGSRGGGERFQWSLYRKNQEYQALAGFLVGAAYLAWRAWV
jgi:protein-S-isoprenylcysteine O-methyltransferase Ste14